jgi:hypothetical protein
MADMVIVINAKVLAYPSSGGVHSVENQVRGGMDPLIATE